MKNIAGIPNGAQVRLSIGGMQKLITISLFPLLSLPPSLFWKFFYLFPFIFLVSLLNLETIVKRPFKKESVLFEYAWISAKVELGLEELKQRKHSFLCIITEWGFFHLPWRLENEEGRVTSPTGIPRSQSIEKDLARSSHNKTIQEKPSKAMWVPLLKT